MPGEREAENCAEKFEYLIEKKESRMVGLRFIRGVCGPDQVVPTAEVIAAVIVKIYLVRDHPDITSSK